MDSLTAHYLARELDARWRERRVTASAFDRDHRSLTLAVEGSSAVSFDLSSSEGAVREATSGPAGGALAGWTVESVAAPEDDRRLVIVLARPGKFRGSPSRRAQLEVSFVPTARGAVVRDAGGRTIASIGARLPPPTPPRPVLADEELSVAATAGDVATLLRGRWMSAPLARWLIADPSRAVARYRALCALPAAAPSRCDGRLLPLPLCDSPERAPSLIESPGASRVPAAHTSDDRRDRALRRMRAELARSADAPRRRATADALMMLGDREPPAEITLADGMTVRVDARTGERAVDVAERLYAEARSMERALEALPARIATLERAPAPTPERPTRPARAAANVAAPEPAREFRTYRSSGGLAIWVGRGAASNDALTFRESSPDDVWLHARDAAGAHVVLRWQRDEPPPARDLEEAALLAAWHSKSRGSALVPVDWTRRKYVRKPRGGAPGLVLVQRSETVFVRPSADAERRLRERT